MLRILLFTTTLALVAPLHAEDAISAESAEITSLRIGFNGAYKLGCWTHLAAEIHGVDKTYSGAMKVTTQDADGVATTVTTPTTAPIREKKIGPFFASAELFLRVGQENAPLTVRFLDEAGKEVAARTFAPGSATAADDGLARGLPATDKLVVTFGAAADLAAELARTDNEASSKAGVRTVLVNDADDLPNQWYGYESVDTVILSGSQLKSYADAATLAPRIAALRRWVELGGQLVIFCGAGSADLLAADGPLAPLLPGRFADEIVPLPAATPIQVFAGAASPLPPLPRPNERVRVPRILDPEGRLLAQGPGELPLAIRARRGLGEITFVAVDPDAAPFAKWNDRTSLLRQALRWPAPAPNVANDRGGAGPAAADLTNQLRSALDQQFNGIATASFALVTLLVLGYIAIIGPGDYFLLKWIKRPQLTWLTIPLVVAASCAGAYALAYRMKGNDLRVNQVEIVDVDVATSNARGTIWTHLFNPRVERYDLTLEPRFAGKFLSEPGRPDPGVPSDLQPPASSPQSLVSWLGVPGQGLGAMQGTRGQAPLFEEGYAFDAQLDKITGLPIEQWSTKSLAARWSANVGPTIDAELHPLGDDQLTGRLTNNTGVRLEECLLIRGGWAYQLPSLDDGAVAIIDDALVSRTLRTTLASVAAGDDPHARTAEDGSVLFDALSTDVARIVKLMMFYDTVGGAASTGTPHRYQSFIDMSRLLQGDQAILLARAPADAGSQWIEGANTQEGDKHPSRPLASDEDRHWLYYRFVLPLAEPEQPTAPTRPIIGPSAVP